MGIESRPSQNIEWEQKLNDILERLNILPKIPGPVFEVVSKGKKFRAETVFIKPLELAQEGYEELLRGNLSDKTYYMFIRDESSEVIAIRISSLDITTKKIGIRSSIEVRDKGKGLATPVDSIFTSFLQYLANEYNQAVEWQVQNENQEKGNLYDL